MEHTSDKPINDSVARVITQFENWKTCIEQPFEQRDDFRSLCEDYDVCAGALEKWQTSTVAIAAQRQQEYSELLPELGQEIRDWLENHHCSDHSGAGA